MATIHFLNVKNGDCSVIEHNSGHVTVIDVCNAKPIDEAFLVESAKFGRGISGNLQQKKDPVNPISYMCERGIKSIFRYIQTHPDMDHMDGIQALFKTFRPINFWDTNNMKEIPNTSWTRTPYSKEDWEFYKKLRDTDPLHAPTRRLTLLSGYRGPFFNVSADGTNGGDGLYVLAPSQGLVDKANQTNDYNACSYVLLFQNEGKRIVFGGDSHDDTWEHILAIYGDYITNIDLLIAPHHGRKSERSYKFLDTLRPTLTFFGNARSEYLAYSAWKDRNLRFITNNQANCMVVDVEKSYMDIYVTHGHFARRCNPRSYYDNKFRAWYVCSITRQDS